MQQEAIDQFKGQLRGELIEPTDPRYEEARKVYNGMISRKPRLIAKCADVADVIAAVRFGREQNLRVSIRGGGHNAGGLGVCDDGLVIDLSLIRYVHVDPSAQDRARWRRLHLGRRGPRDACRSGLRFRPESFRHRRRRT